MPTLLEADAVLDQSIADAVRELDANDVLYQVGASWDYDPAPALEQIRAPLVAVNSADDLINPPEPGILEREIKRVRRGRAVVIPLSQSRAGMARTPWPCSGANIWRSCSNRTSPRRCPPIRPVLAGSVIVPSYNLIPWEYRSFRPPRAALGHDLGPAFVELIGYDNAPEQGVSQ